MALTPHHLPELTDALRRAFGDNVTKVVLNIETCNIITAEVTHLIDKETATYVAALIGHGVWAVKHVDMNTGVQSWDVVRPATTIEEKS